MGNSGTKRFMAITAACALLALPLAGRASDVTLEATAADIVLPLQPPSTLSVAPCRNCPLLLLLTSKHTEYTINDQPVELEEFRRRLAEQPRAYVGIKYDSRTRDLHALRALLGSGL